MKKIFMFVNVDWFFYSHRLPIANASREHDINMFVFTDITDKEKNQTPSEYRMVQSPLTRKLNNPWSLFSEFLSALSLIYREKPDVIHAVTIKPILFMGLIAKLTKTPFIAAISGFGPVMEQNNFIKKLRFKMVLLIYRFIFSPPQNSWETYRNSRFMSGRICHSFKSNFKYQFGLYTSNRTKTL